MTDILPKRPKRPRDPAQPPNGGSAGRTRSRARRPRAFSPRPVGASRQSQSEFGSSPRSRRPRQNDRLDARLIAEYVATMPTHVVRSGQPQVSSRTTTTRAMPATRLHRPEPSPILTRPPAVVLSFEPWAARLKWLQCISLGSGGRRLLAAASARNSPLASGPAPGD